MSTRPTPNDKDKPWPSPPRDPDKAKQSHIYALLVGINAYEPVMVGEKREDLSLDGCIKDVENVKQYLEKTYPEDRRKIETLTDQEATYDKVIEAFENHLIKGGGTSNDTFWFHFSGHGSQMPTADEFFEPKDERGKPLSSLAPTGMDETLVCYNPGGSKEGIFLADKELAALIAKIHETAGKEGEGTPHILISLDCCHSGTGTKDPNLTEAVKSRLANFLEEIPTDRSSVANDLKRSIDSYYGYKRAETNGFLSNQRNLRVPQTQHLLISGCSAQEKAGDSSLGGIFTTSFIQTLEEMGSAPINYVDLFTRVRTRSKRRRDTQTPQFEPIGGFNPYTAFLDGYAHGQPGKHEVRKIEQKDESGNVVNSWWSVRAGAVNGIPVPTKNAEMEETTQVLIFEARGNRLVGNARLGKVGVQNSRLEDLKKVALVDGRHEATHEELILHDDLHYFAKIYAVPAAPLHIRLKGEVTAKQALINAWTIVDIEKDSPNLENLNIHHVEEGTTEEVLLEIECDQERVEGDILLQYTLNYVGSPEKKPWFGFEGEPDKAPQIAKDNIEKFAKWQRMIDLQNDESSLQSLYDLEFRTLTLDVWNENGKPFPNEKPDEFIDIMDSRNLDAWHELNIDQLAGKLFPISGEDGFKKQDNLYFQYRIHAKNPSVPVFFYLFGLSSDAGISFLAHEEIPARSTGVHNLGAELAAFLGPNEQSATFYFKVIVTHQKIEEEALTQKGFLNDRSGFGGGFTPPVDMEDWHVSTLVLRLKR